MWVPPHVAAHGMNEHGKGTAGLSESFQSERQVQRLVIYCGGKVRGCHCGGEEKGAQGHLLSLTTGQGRRGGRNRKGDEVWPQHGDENKGRETMYAHTWGPGRSTNSQGTLSQLVRAELGDQAYVSVLEFPGF